MFINSRNCPNCGESELHLNDHDLWECPNCHLVCASLDGVIATIMPFLGNGSFREGLPATTSLKDLGFAKSKNGSVLPDLSTIFSSNAEIKEYVAGLSYKT